LIIVAQTQGEIAMPIPAGFSGALAFVDALPIPKALDATAGGKLAVIVFVV
jgi:hypothetical protein